jgi:hypothetical protein
MAIMIERTRVLVEFVKSFDSNSTGEQKEDNIKNFSYKIDKLKDKIKELRCKSNKGDIATI